ncbi:velvet factor-domain-containing protein [Flagelloscypha sp. PMI_526]|nr:velvet factor-domain-containing protein [Flagelloscypha sp. PMI_526]
MDHTGIGAGALLHHSGQYAGQTIRMKIVEVQSATRGRKYGTVDRRPIDPPPVILLSIFKVENPGTAFQYETEVDYEHVLTAGLFCTIDIISINPAQNTVGSSTTTASAAPFSQMTEMPQATPAVVDRLPNNATKLIVGEKTVPAFKIQHEGKGVIAFAFGDIAVRGEGTFQPYYRALDIMNIHDSHSPITASCSGGQFRVYSTKDFPGLAGSTQLTRILSDAGANVHIRAEGSHRRRTSMVANPLIEQPTFSPSIYLPEDSFWWSR